LLIGRIVGKILAGNQIKTTARWSCKYFRTLTTVDTV